MALLRALTFMLLVVAAGCNESPNAPSGDPLVVGRLSSSEQPLTFNSGLSTSSRIVIRDDHAWREAWTAIWQRHSPLPPLPVVDFSREMVIVAALGTRPTGGHSIIVGEANENAETVTVQIRTFSPGPGCAVTLALTQPVDVARMTRRDKPVVFDETHAVTDCR